MRRVPLAGPALLVALALAGCGQTQATGPTSTGATSLSPSSQSPAAGTSVAPSSGSSSPAMRTPQLRIQAAGFHLPAAFGRAALVDTPAGTIVAGGLVGGDSSTSAAYRIDPAQGRVAALPSLPVPVHDTAGALAGGEPIVIGGGNAVEQSVVQRWDGRRWQVVGHLPQARSDLVAATVGGRVVVLGGYNGSRPAEPAILSSTNGRRWTRIGTLPVPVRYAASTVSEGSIWLFGGETSDVERRVIQRVDPSTGRASVVGKLPVALGHAVAIPLGNRILIAGGRLRPDVVTDRMWWFDPSSGTVTPAGHLPHPLADSAVAEAAGVHYLLGGETPSVTDGVLAVTY